MAFREIRGALTKAVVDWARGENLPMYTENTQGFQSPPSELYARLRVSRAGVFAGDMDGLKRTHLGNVLVILSSPENVSTGEIDRMADSLQAAFPVYRRMAVTGGPVVEITGPVDLTLPTDDGDRYMVTLVLPWRAAFYE